MKKILATLLAAVLLLGATVALAENIAILVPNADHGWTGAVLTYAEEKAAEINAAGTYSARVIPASDPANQIAQVEDIIATESDEAVVILPYDNTLEATLQKLVAAEIPFVQFDRVIDAVAGDAIANVKGDNEGIGIESAKRFIAKGLQPGDPVLIIPGDNSSVPEMRNNGFFATLQENGWSDEQIAGIKSTAYTGWSRSEGRKLFEEWLEASSVDEIAATKYIFTHDDEIAMGILEALKGGAIDPAKKDAFLGGQVNLATSSGLNEIYSVLKGIHQNDYTAEVSKLADLFSVTYDPAMIQIAIQDIVDANEDKEVPVDHVIPVSVVDASNVDQFRGFGDAFAK
ncbi:MAG: substrate-binding domain-containing protein [Oscillospiraceae bacterium]|jgi:ribose transport system substrate-binding protein|nr:substrate-binding domain-containing protein [Oscillospiraceae bacterium]